MTIDLFERKKTHFVLWRPGHTDPAPALYIGQIAAGEAPFKAFREIPLTQVGGFPDLWQVAARDCKMLSGKVYHYWFKVRQSNPYDSRELPLYATDPTAVVVDWRYQAPAPSEKGSMRSGDAAGVIMYKKGQLIPCDPGGQTVDTSKALSAQLPPNHKLVIYELPTRWTKSKTEGSPASIGTGTFRDVEALIDPQVSAPDFRNIAVLQEGNSHLSDLGINALELLPPADSPDRYNDDKYKWGYGTANYFAADSSLGHPEGKPAPTASSDLAHLIDTCHQHGIRFFLDAVMAFARENPYKSINFLDFFIHWKPKDDPTRDPEQGDRDGFGGDLLKYGYWVNGYHPLSGKKDWYVPSREYMKAHIAHWMLYYKIDGLRLDSVNNIASYDFLEECKDMAREIWASLGGKSEQFLVVGEELSVPLALVHQRRLDGLWNERFKHISRKVLLGQASEGEIFEQSVYNLIDCRNLGFTDGAQAVNYLTSHDVGGYGNERLYNYLINNGVTDVERRIKLGFVCLLTAVGIPMILAGDEFADQHDLAIDNAEGDSNKQVDPVNYDRMKEDWRRRVFDYVVRLVHFRTESEALSLNDTRFIHQDFSHGKRVIVWQRGSGPHMVVVVANFSDFGTDKPFDGGEYVVPHFPATPAGRYWREVTQSRRVADEWVGREAVFPWEAKVYTLE
ncbi:MAG: alpha amylase [Bacteroidetes bacterium]|nr:MAG: alpha amylase [Bacteroidota bacterium]